MSQNPPLDLHTPNLYYEKVSKGDETMIEKRYLWTLILLFLVGYLAGPYKIWAADYSTAPVKSAVPARQPAVSWKPVTPHAARFNQNYSRVQALTREIEASINIMNRAKTTRENMNKMAALRKLLREINKDLQEVLQELAAVNSLMREAGSLDQQRRVDRNRGDQLASRLEQKHSVLEKKKVALTAKIKMLEDKLGNMADMHQLNMMKLQEMQNRLNQMMNMISNMMKNAHDTAQSIIQNMR